MAKNFKIKKLKRGDVLYVIPKGDFDGSSAAQLKNFIADEWKKGNLKEIRLNTTKLGTIDPFGFGVWSNVLLHCLGWPKEINLTFSAQSKKLNKK